MRNQRSVMSGILMAFIERATEAIGFKHMIPATAIVVSGLLIACGGGGNNAVNGLEFDPDNGSISLPGGFGAFVVADDLGRGRHMVVRENGDIYVALRELNNGGGIAALRDTSGDGRADIVRYFGELPGTGIDIYNNYLYFGSDTSVARYQLTPGELVPEGDPVTIAHGFPFQTQHAVKPFTFDDSGNMYVNVGAPSNACQEQDRTKGSPGMDPCPLLERHGGIWQFDADEPGQTQVDDGYHYATGLRNCVALDWNYQADHLYVVQHGRDQLYQLYPDYFNERQSARLPAEEFHLIEDGDNCGWPYSYYDQLQETRVLAPEYGGNGQEVGRASQYQEPIMGFPGHWAPNDLIFYQGDMFPEKFSNGAFIAFHGSWNRAPRPQAGYNVVFVPFDG
ncbi:MAG TPA: PQQ-dependent sugar dehydrogenase, partial [bacterium]|nr:PQQ-dependent sugar dehydrogenase [bacterium]